MTPSTLISVFIIGSVELLAFVGVRKRLFSPWVALLLVSLVSAIAGIYYVYSKGDSLIGAFCLSPILVFSFGVPTLLLSFAIKPKDNN
jgi:1,4-dihydroxy-2-naphthoate octaprenyltransferase